MNESVNWTARLALSGLFCAPILLGLIPQKSVVEKFAIHPFLFPVYPVLFLFSLNIDQASVSEVLVPTALAILGTAALWSLTWLLLRDQKKSGVLVTLCIFLFFSYGHFYMAIEGLGIELPEARIHFVLVILWAGLGTLGTYFIRRTRGDLGQLTSFLNIMGAFLVVISLVNIASHSISTPPRKPDTPLSTTRKAYSGDRNSYPDIYYVVLDGYARQDTLIDLYDYDNSFFIGYLRKKGFYVADKSMSNYNQTALSMASSLNFNYIQNLFPDADPDSADRTLLNKSETRNNPTIVKLLKEYDYEFINFSSGYSDVEFRQADRFLKAPSSLTEFQNVLLNTTVISAILGPLIKSIPFQYEARRKELKWVFERLPELSRFNSNIFVYAHILAPHPPFVFGPNGEARNPSTLFTIADGSHYFAMPGNSKERYVSGYRDQLEYINLETIRMIERILANSKWPPVIILQSDHGPGSEMFQEVPQKTNMRERMGNLNAFYFPDHDYGLLYDSITPVNNFRVVLTKYFQEVELLGDKSYAASWSRPFLFYELSRE